MASIEEVLAEIERRDALKRRQAELDPARVQQELLQQQAQETGALEAGLVAAGRGIMTIGRGLGLAEPEAPIETQAFRQLEEQRPVATTIGEIAGQTAPFLVPGVGAAGLATLPARALATAGLGAAEGALITGGEGGDIGQQIIGAGVGGTVAGLAELALPSLARAGGKLIRRVLGKAPEGQIVDAAGKPSAEFVEALNKSGLTIDDIAQQERLSLAGQAVDPEQAARRAFLESQGLEPTRAQVTRGAADFQAQQEAAKTSSRVREALEKQEALLSTRFDNAIVESGGEAVTPTSTVTDSLVNKASILDTEISALYKQAGEIAQGRATIRAEALVPMLRSLKGQDKATGGAISAVKSDLIDKGIINKKFKILSNLDVNSAEDVRKVMNQLFDPQQPFRNIKLRQLKDAIDDDVFRSAGDDVFKQARAAKTTFERELSRAKISKFDNRKQNLVRDVLENKIDPDALTEKVVFGKSYRADDLKQLKDYIGTDEAGVKAFDDLRAEVLQKIKEKAFFGPADEAGFQALSRDKLQKALSSIGKKKMDVIFNKQEQRFLHDMVKVAKLREPVRGTALGQGPSAQAVNRLRAEIRKGSIMANILDSVTFDKKGRAVLKSTPERFVKDVTPQARQAQQAISQAGAVGAVGLTQQEQ